MSTVCTHHIYTLSPHYSVGFLQGEKGDKGDRGEPGVAGRAGKPGLNVIVIAYSLAPYRQSNIHIFPEL